MVDAEGQQLGVIPVADALSRARAAGLDLVEVSPNVQPPVCRIMNYGKFVFGRKKVTKHQRQSHLKEIKLRPVTEEGDFQVKLRSIQRFLKQGDKVKVTLRFRGREMLHQELGVRLLDKMRAAVEEMAIIEQEPKLEGKQVVMVLGPRPSKGSSSNTVAKGQKS